MEEAILPDLEFIRYHDLSVILNSNDNYPAEIKRLSLFSVLECLAHSSSQAKK